VFIPALLHVSLRREEKTDRCLAQLHAFQTSSTLAAPSIQLVL
jgi:hypothetical protein